jgi:hypothetical protein
MINTETGRLDFNCVYEANMHRFLSKIYIIAKLEVEDRIIFEQHEKKEAVWEFYNQLLGTAGQRDFTLNLEALHQRVVDLSDLDESISEEELWAAIKSIPPDKAPGPNGFTGCFQ